MKKKMKVLMLVGALGAMLFGLTGCGSTTVDLNEYISVDISGYDSMGQANIRFDKDAFEEDFGDKIEAKINKQGGDAAKMSLELQFGEEPYEVMLNYCADYRVEKPDNLSNGDVVKLVWECETENAKEFFNCNLKYSDMEFKVEGLKELKTFNPFDYVTVEIEGVSPKGYASLVVDSSPEEMQYITFIADKLNDLSNGDVIVLKANMLRTEEDFALKFDSIPSPLTMEYQVKDLPSYAKSVSEIDEATLTAMKQQAEEIYKAHWLNVEGNMDGLNELNYIGNYYLSKKEGERFTDENHIYMVYKVDCSWDGVNYPHYVYVKFSNITVDEAGKGIVDMSQYELVNDKWWPTGDIGGIYYYGYGTLDELYNAFDAALVERYTFENNIE
ncbi:MAG: hypothetical protein IKJ39_10655 [Lachnospiraceae bacterium]|nr:hypothetical protein [Lachnospiraceae bacterium]